MDRIRSFDVDYFIPNEQKDTYFRPNEVALITVQERSNISREVFSYHIVITMKCGSQFCYGKRDTKEEIEKLLEELEEKAMTD